MPLSLTVDSLDTIPEAIRSEYVERDGKFHLNVEGAEDTSALKGALAKERQAAKDAAKRAAQYEGLGLSADEIKEIVEAKQRAERVEAEKAGNFDKILAQHKTEWQKQLEALTTERDTALKSEREAVVGTRLMAALTKAGATEEGIDLLPERLAARIKYETEAGARVLRIMSADGETPMAGASKDGTATFDDLVKEATTKFPSLFKGVGAGGSGTQPGKGSSAAGGKTITRAAFMALSASEKMATARTHRLVD